MEVALMWMLLRLRFMLVLRFFKFSDSRHSQHCMRLQRMVITVVFITCLRLARQLILQTRLMLLIFVYARLITSLGLDSTPCNHQRRSI